MKTEDLYLEYARVIKMCEGTNVKPWDCVKNSLRPGRYDDHPTFTLPPDSYMFADKPVLSNGDCWSNAAAAISRQPTENTFTLNGEELRSNGYVLAIIGLDEHNYHFSKSEDIRKVEDAINELLREATK